MVKPGQTLILAGCFSGTATNTAWVICGGQLVPQPEPLYNSNSPEADTLLWRHALQSNATKVLIYSPDTDVYNIGLGLITTNKTTFIVQINTPQCDEKYLNLNQLLQALDDDPDLASLPVKNLGKILQTLYICSGCDYISYIHGHGKATVFNVFYQHAEFVCGQKMEGSLSETSHHKRDSGFLAFTRLIGTLYFKKHLSSFVSVYSFENPNQLFNSISTTITTEKHKLWLDKIREVVAERITNEEDRVPSHTALWRHWLRVCWVSDMYSNSPKQDILDGITPPENSGWTIDAMGNHSIDWDAPDLQERVKGTIQFLTKGCTCKHGCKTRRCSCKKKSKHCGPGCECQGCVNLDVKTRHSSPSDTSNSDSDDTENESELRLECEVITNTIEEFIDWT